MGKGIVAVHVGCKVRGGCWRWERGVQGGEGRVREEAGGIVISWCWGGCGGLAGPEQGEEDEDEPEHGCALWKESMGWGRMGKGLL